MGLPKRKIIILFHLKKIYERPTKQAKTIVTIVVPLDLCICLNFVAGKSVKTKVVPKSNLFLVVNKQFLEITSPKIQETGAP